MSDPPTAKARLNGALLSIGLIALSFLIATFVWIDFATLFADLRRSAPVVTVPIGGAIAVPVVVMLLGVAAILIDHALWSKPSRRYSALWIAILCGFPLMVALPIGLSVWSGESLRQRGYARCHPADHGGRNPTSVWTRGQAACDRLAATAP